jgi:hypothetical protein
VTPSEPLSNFFVIVYFTIVFQQNPAVAATKGLGTAGTSDYCKPSVPKSAFPTQILKLKSHPRNGIGFDNAIVSNQAGSIWSTIHHTVEHRAYQWHNILTLFA